MIVFVMLVTSPPDISTNYNFRIRPTQSLSATTDKTISVAVATAKRANPLLLGSATTTTRGGTHNSRFN